MAQTSLLTLSCGTDYCNAALAGLPQCAITFRYILVSQLNRSINPTSLVSGPLPLNIQTELYRCTVSIPVCVRRI